MAGDSARPTHRSLNWVWDTNLLTWVVETQPGGSSGGGTVAQGAAGTAAWLVDGSAHTQPVSAAALPLPTGAATAAKQPALGTAGAASADVITVQGVASMTALKVDGSAVTQPVSGSVSVSNFPATQPVSGTVTTSPPANASTNVAQLAGTAPDTNSGLKSAGTLRVVLATDQPALTNKLLVTPDSVALPANQSVNVSQFGGTNAVTGTGASAAGVPRVTVSNDSNVLVTPPTLTKGTQGATGFSTQDVKDAGRTYIAITIDRAAGISVEALATMTINKAETVTTATSYTVTTGKTLRLQTFKMSVRASTTTIVSARGRLRTAASSIAASSPLLAALEAGSNGAIAEDINVDNIDFPDGLEIAGTHQIAISHVESTATGTVTFTLIGYEY